MSAKATEPDLIAVPLPDWTVFTSHPKGEHAPSHNELRFKGRKQATGTAEHGRKRMVEMAELFNANNAVPRRKHECAADAANPSAYLANLPVRQSSSH